MKLRYKNSSISSSLALFLLLFLCIFAVRPSWATPEITARLSETSIPINAYATLTVTLTNTDSGQLVMPQLPGIQLRQRGQSSQFSSINGKISRSTSYTYILTGEKEGKYTLPPISFKTEGKTLKSKAISFSITPMAANNNNLQPKTAPEPLSQQPPSKLAMLRVTAPHKIYSGESVPVEIKLYFAANTKIERGSITLPTITSKGIIMEPLSSSPAQGREEYNGRVWDTLSWQTTFSAIKEGENSLSIAASATALLEQRQKRRERSRSPFDSFFGGNPFDDPFFDNVFTNYIKKPLHLSWQDKITVLPLPAAGRPENFSGAVGDFDITVSTRTKEIEIGDPLLLEIAVNGIGNFNKVEAPGLPENNRWRTYPPKAHFEPIGNTGGGQKIFEQAVVIRDQSITEIPSLSFCYFNPEKKQYITKKSAPVPVKIKGKSNGTNSQVTPKTPQETIRKIPQQQEEASDQHLLKIELGEMTGDMRPLPQRPWFQGATIFFLLLYLCGIIVRYMRKKREGSQQNLRKRMLHRLYEDLIPIQAAKENNDSVLFLRACRVAIQNSLARRCQKHPSVVSLGDIQRILPAASPIIKIFSMADQASYSDKEIPVAELDKLYDELKSELENLL